MLLNVKNGKYSINNSKSFHFHPRSAEGLVWLQGALLNSNKAALPHSVTTHSVISHHIPSTEYCCTVSVVNFCVRKKYCE